MAKTIVQKVLFKNISPALLYDLYMNAKKHFAATGAAAKISATTGTSFSAYDNYIKGKNLHLVKNRQIVQTWRASDWNKDEPDSIFIINLEQKGNDTVLHAIHANVPDRQAKSIDKGWHDFYWEPWKEYLGGKKITKKEM